MPVLGDSLKTLQNCIENVHIISTNALTWVDSCSVCSGEAALNIIPK